MIKLEGHKYKCFVYQLSIAVGFSQGMDARPSEKYFNSLFGFPKDPVDSHIECFKCGYPQDPSESRLVLPYPFFSSLGIAILGKVNCNR